MHICYDHNVPDPQKNLAHESTLNESYRTAEDVHDVVCIIVGGSSTQQSEKLEI
jgi:hypothetical protein